MERNCMYLRKSRLDIEAEQRGEGETLKRHEQRLIALANQLHIVIDPNGFYREVVSGETISQRPEMQRLLNDVEQGLWDNVLVVEVERLARGDTIDQGIVAQAFKYSDTKIITPAKVYNPNNEFDEEFFEFGLFMSRREYKTIKRRLNNGRIASVKEGKYCGSVPPFGYDRMKIKGDKGYTLSLNIREAPIVKMIYDYYANENMSYNQIADKLNSLSLKPRRTKLWTISAIKDILNNPVYIGKIRWNGRKTIKKSYHGTVKSSRPRNDGDDVIIVDGIHEPIISNETYLKVLHRKAIRKSQTPKIASSDEIKNPLAGLVVCGVCGEKMQRRPYVKSGAKPSLICTNKECNNISSYLSVVEKAVLQGIKKWLKDYSVEIKQELSSDTESLKTIEKNILSFEKLLEQEKEKLYKTCDFFERGIYTKEIYFERSQMLSQNIDKMRDDIRLAKEELRKEKQYQQYKYEYVPQLQNVIDVYQSEDITVEQKNQLLKSILEKVVYIKSAKAKKGNGTCQNFKIDIFPIIPEKPLD